MQWLWWAPLVAAVAHITEEFVYPGGFAAWDRQYRPQFRRSITPRLHVIINGVLVVVCLRLGLLTTYGGYAFAGIPPQYNSAVWLAVVALMFSNAVFHVVGTIRTRRASPGVRTALLLYVPLAAYGFWRFLSDGLVSWRMAMLAALAGGSYHLWASVLHYARARRSGLG